MVHPNSAWGIDEGTTYGASSPPDFTGAAFENIRSSDRLPVFFGKVVIAQRLSEVFLQALDGSSA
jgi:hypothetical protein